MSLEKAVDKSDKAVIVFAKEPVLGKVKTRLAQSIGDESALRLYQAFVKDVLKNVSEHKNSQHYLYYASLEEDIPFLKKEARDHLMLRQQSGADLGLRMLDAFNSILKIHKSVIIIGTDCLNITEKLLNEAFDLLIQNDVVIGPTKDGGYYLIGMKDVYEPLFKEIPWSTPKVFQQTIRNIDRMGLEKACLPYHDDIDDLLSLKKLVKGVENLEGCNHTKKIINNINF